MSLTANSHTLRHHLARPVFSSVPIATAPMMAVGPRMGEYLKASGSISVAGTAERFYLLNHFMAELRRRHGLDDHLSAEELGLVNEYVGHLNHAAERMLVYLTLITTCEVRHIKASGVEGNQTWVTYLHRLRKYENTSDRPKILGSTLFSSAPVLSFAEYVAFLVKAFKSPVWGGGSFGGPKWGNVAQCLLDYVCGTLTAERMMDTAFHLAHNGGPIFDKNMLFLKSKNLEALLNHQAAGEMPRWVDKRAEDAASKEYLTRMRAMFGWALEKSKPQGIVMHGTETGSWSSGKYNFEEVPKTPTAGMVEVMPGVVVPKVKKKRPPKKAVAGWKGIHQAVEGADDEADF